MSGAVAAAAATETAPAASRRQASDQGLSGVDIARERGDEGLEGVDERLVADPLGGAETFDRVERVGRASFATSAAAIGTIVAEGGAPGAQGKAPQRARCAAG